MDEIPKNKTTKAKKIPFERILSRLPENTDVLLKELKDAKVASKSTIYDYLKGRKRLINVEFVYRVTEYLNNRFADSDVKKVDLKEWIIPLEDQKKTSNRVSNSIHSASV